MTHPTNDLKHFAGFSHNATLKPGVVVVGTVLTADQARDQGYRTDADWGRGRRDAAKATDTLRELTIALYRADYPGGGAGHPDASDSDAMMFEKYEAHYGSCVRAVIFALRDPGRRALDIGADAAMNSVPEMSQHDCNVDADMMAVGFAAVIDELLKGER